MNAKAHFHQYPADRPGAATPAGDTPAPLMAVSGRPPAGRRRRTGGVTRAPIPTASTVRFLTADHSAERGRGRLSGGTVVRQDDDRARPAYHRCSGREVEAP